MDQDSHVDAFTYPETGRKRQAAPSLAETYSGWTITSTQTAKLEGLLFGAAAGAGRWS
jgi:hypothetical protein